MRKKSIRQCREYTTWTSMMTRCYNSGRRYRFWNGRGIKVCGRWHDFINFLEDMGRRPSDQHSIDRIDNDAHYSCGKCDECRMSGWTANCRWATRIEQANNKRSNNNKRRNNKICVGGVEKTVAEWSRITGIKQGTIRSRIDAGWSADEILKEVQEYEKLYTIDGETRNFREWCREYNISSSTVWKRMTQKGMTLGEALTLEVRELGQSNSKYIEIDGVTKNLQEWAEHYGIHYASIRRRIRKGVDPVTAITEARQDCKWVTIDGETKTIVDWCREYGISYYGVKNRMRRRGMTFEQALKKPVAGKIEIDGQVKTRKEWCRHFGVGITTVKNREKTGMTFEQAVKLKRRPGRPMKQR